MRPYLSVKISSPAGPTTTAVCAALDGRSRRDALRPERDRGGDALERVSVGQLLPVAGPVVGGEFGRVLHLRQDVVAVAVEVLFEGKLVPGGHLAAVAAPRMTSALAASSSIRIPTVRLLSSKIFCTSAGLSPPPLSTPSNRRRSRRVVVQLQLEEPRSHSVCASLSRPGRSPRLSFPLPGACAAARNSGRRV